MSLRLSKFSTLIALVALAVGCGGGDTAGEGGSSARPQRFTLPHVLPQNHPVHKALVRFAEEVESRSNGQMQIRIQEGGTLGTEVELVENVVNGTDDFTKISATVLETKTDKAKVFTLPYLFRDDEHMWATYESEVGRELLDMALDHNLKGIAFFTAGARSFYTRQPVSRAEDLRGMKLRVQNSVMMQRLVTSLGASPQMIPWGELYGSLETGIVAGAENNIPSYYTESHYRVAPHFIFTEHVRIPDMLMMNADRWNSLTPEQQQIITEAAAVAVAYQRQVWEDDIAEQMGLLEQAGVTFTYPSEEVLQGFRDATRVVYQEVEGTPVMEYVERIRAIGTGVADAPAAADEATTSGESL